MTGRDSVAGNKYMSYRYPTEAPFTAVKEFFRALSEKSPDVIRDHLAADFLLLEQGQVWDASRLIDAVQGDYTRSNHFALVDGEVQSGRAWLAYWNRGLFEYPDSGRREFTWIESACLERRGERWLLRMLHSTRTDGSNIPAGLQLVEDRPG